MQLKHMLPSENVAGKTALPCLGCWDSDKWNTGWCPIYFLFKVFANIGTTLVALERHTSSSTEVPFTGRRVPSDPHFSLLPFPVTAKLGDCLNVSRQGFRLAKLQALQWIHLESVAWEFIHGHVVTLSGLSWSSKLRFFSQVLFNIQMFSVAEARSHVLPGSNLSLTQPTKIIAMSRRMKALRKIFSPSNTKYCVNLYLPNLSWEKVSNFLISLLRKQVGSCSQSNTWSINIWN